MNDTRALAVLNKFWAVYCLTLSLSLFLSLFLMLIHRFTTPCIYPAFHILLCLPAGRPHIRILFTFTDRPSPAYTVTLDLLEFTDTGRFSLCKWIIHTPFNLLAHCSVQYNRDISFLLLLPPPIPPPVYTHTTFPGHSDHRQVGQKRGPGCCYS